MKEEQDSGWRVVGVIPTFAVGDLEQAIAFYRRLGFRHDWSYPEEGEPTQVGLCFGAQTVMLALCTDPPEQIGRQNVYFVLDSLDAYHASLRATLGDTLPAIADIDYEMRDFALTDPWGHLLTFGEAG